MAGDRSDAITVVEQRRHAVSRRIRYEPRSDGRVTRTVCEWDVSPGGRWRGVGSEVLESVEIEAPAGVSQTGP